jgi:hypothetical protein
MGTDTGNLASDVRALAIDNRNQLDRDDKGLTSIV